MNIHKIMHYLMIFQDCGTDCVITKGMETECVTILYKEDDDEIWMDGTIGSITISREEFLDEYKHWDWRIE